MCVTGTARRSSLTLHVLPCHLLTKPSSAEASSKVNAATDASTIALSLHHLSSSPKQELETQPTLSKVATPKRSTKKSSKNKNSSFHAHHPLPHHDGLVVQHHYHDHATDPVVDPSLIKHKAKGGVIIPFPVKLHDMLNKIEEDGLAGVVSWQPHGRCFVVHKPKEFVNHVMPHYFKQTKMASFQRQLNLYGFNRLTGGLDKGGYYHEMFLKGKVSLAYDIHRMRVKGTGVRLPTNPENEPNFYALPPVTQSDTIMPPLPTFEESRFPEALPPLPPPNVSSSDAMVLGIDMTQRRAELLRESRDHSRKIARAKQTRHQSHHGAESDVVFFEGLPFHYLDPSALPSRTCKQQPWTQQQHAHPPLVVAEETRAPIDHSSSIVSDSDSENDNNNNSNNDDAFLPSFSPAKMDWDGPLSCPTLQAHMRRSSFQSFPKESNAMLVDTRPLEEDIESFFQGFDMPVDMYHDRIERMGDDDDTAFGYLLEQAITE